MLGLPPASIGQPSLWSGLAPESYISFQLAGCCFGARYAASRRLILLWIFWPRFHQTDSCQILLLTINTSWSRLNQSVSLDWLNPRPVELFHLHFSSFEAGISNAIFSFKWWKIWLFMKNKHVWILTFRLTEHLSQTILWISVSFYFLWNLLETAYIRLQQHKG